MPQTKDPGKARLKRPALCLQEETFVSGTSSLWGLIA